MKYKLFTFFVLPLCLSITSIAQTSSNENLEWQDLDSLLQAEPLSAGDKIFVNVRKVPQITGEYIVDEIGNVDFPLIGTINVAGQTSESIGELLEVLYEKDYLVDPHITVEKSANPLIHDTINTIDEPVNEPEFNDLGNDLSAATIIDSDSASVPVYISPEPEPEPEPEPLANIDKLITETSEDFDTIISDTETPEYFFLLEGTGWSMEGNPEGYIQFLGDGNIAGSLGCNSFFAVYKTSDNNINIQSQISTLIDCEDNSKPNDFIEILETSNRYIATQDRLRLLNQDNEELISLKRISE